MVTTGTDEELASQRLNHRRHDLNDRIPKRYRDGLTNTGMGTVLDDIRINTRSLRTELVDPSWRRSFLHYDNYEKQFPYAPNVRGIRTDEWKLRHLECGGRNHRFSKRLVSAGDLRFKTRGGIGAF